MKRIRKFLALSSLEKRIVITAAFILPACAVGLRTVGFRRTQEHMLRGQTNFSIPLASKDLLLAQGISHAVEIAAVHGPYRATCLTRSLVLVWLLSKHGILSEIKIGATVAEGDFSAHAWVVSGDVVLNDTPEVTDRFGAFEPAFKNSA